jgi:hypothetical protein
MGECAPLRAPFPWFGGKRRVAAQVWQAFGDVANYVEPFAGSLAVLLGRPTAPRIETVNDLDCYLANFWRAVSIAPDEVARCADWPVNEADLHARHRWLVGRTEFRERMRRDPDFFDAKIAGWWVWGLCQWIGSGWCWTTEARGRDQVGNGKHPDLHRGHGVHSRGTYREGTFKTDWNVSLENAVNWEGRSNAGRRPRGIHTAEYRSRPDLTADRGIRSRNLVGSSEWEKRPSLGRGARGVQLKQQMPMLSGDSGASGRGVHASAAEPILEWIRTLAARLRLVRVCCGDWKRVLGPSVTEKIGITGVFLDPPYSAEAGRDPSIYSQDDLEVAHEVREWALENGSNPRLRIALCGYEGEHEMPGWHCFAWKAVGGYAASAGNTENAAKERIWFSPACLSLEGERQRSLQLEVVGGGA